LLLEHALGLLRLHGPAEDGGGNDDDNDGQDEAAPTADADAEAIAALQPFLFEHAPRFWAELSSFARSGLSVEAWDGLRLTGRR